MKRSTFVLSLLLAFFTTIGVADEIHLVFFNDIGAVEATGAGTAIEVTSFSLGESNAGPSGVDTFSIHKNAANNAAVLGLALGKKYAEVALTIQRTTTGPSGKTTVYLTYTFTEVSIESITWGGSIEGDKILNETITFRFTRVVSSVSEKNPRGSGGIIGDAWTVTTASEQ